MPHKFILLVLMISLPFLLTSYIIADENPEYDIRILFSPQDECGKAILDKINSAEKSIELAMYHLTSRILSQALIKAADRGVVVRVYLDGENAREHYSKANFLKKRGVLVKHEKGEGLMHNKFCIIDDKLVITGSYNWTTSADLRNDENVIFINSAEIAKIYRIQFERYWQESYADRAYYINKNTLQKHTLSK
jgi:phosphatidylserine/phosphatidylglycerophosphate/cardiolipin synthase-like enzyme